MFALFLSALFIALLVVGLGRPPRGDLLLTRLRRGVLGGFALALGGALALAAASALPVTAGGLDSPLIPTPARAAEATDPAASETAAGTPASDAEADTFSLEDSDGFPKVSIPYENRPEWVSLERDFTGDVHRVPLTVGPFVQKSECDKALDEALREAVSEYIATYLNNPRAPLFIHYELPEIKQRLVDEGHVYDEQIEVSLGKMHQVHALLEFDSKFRGELDRSWRDVQAGIRLAQTGLVAFGVLGLLGVIFGYFKLDTATRGYYSTRLQILASLAILALIVASVLFYGWIPRL